MSGFLPIVIMLLSSGDYWQWPSFRRTPESSGVDLVTSLGEHSVTCFGKVDIRALQESLLRYAESRSECPCYRRSQRESFIGFSSPWRPSRKDCRTA